MITQVTLDNVTYNIPQASAVEQKRLLLILGGKVALNSSASRTEQINTTHLVGTLMTLPDQTFDDVVKIVLSRVRVHGDEAPVTVDSFQGRMAHFVRLIAECVQVNLSDFFGWLDDVNADTRQQTTGMKKS